MKYTINSRITKIKTLNLLVLVIDLFIVLNTYFLSCLIYFNIQLISNLSNILLQLPFVLLTAFLVFLLTSSYKGIIRNSNSKNTFKSLIVCSVIGLIFLISNFVFNKISSFNNEFSIPLSVVFIHFFLNVIALVSIRFLYKEIYSLIISNFKPHQIQDVTIEEIVGRDSIELNNELLKKEYINKSVLVSGAAGSIGSELSRQLAGYGCKNLILIDQSESDLYNLQQVLYNKNFENITPIVADVRNELRMKSIISEHQPTIIFHAAAYKHVPFMEENPYEAISVNVLGSKILAELAVEYGVEKFVMISTDKAVNPTNVMGASKRVAEMYVDCLNKKGKTKFITTRFGNVLGSNGSVIPLFKEQIKRGGPITVTHREISRFFMTVSEACQLVLEAGAIGKGGEIFVFDMGKSLKIYDLAVKMIQFSGLNFPSDIDIKIIGLRPGEKIHEELLGVDESAVPTNNKKILIVKFKKRDSSKIYNQINELIEINNELDIIKTVLKIKEIVPEFISNNSDYEYLDSKNID